MTTLIILVALVGAAALRAGGILPGNDPPYDGPRHLPSERRLPAF